MSKEEDVAVLLRADATLTALLTGGIYTEEELGVEGFRRGEDSPCDAAFDDDGLLKPCALVRETGDTPFGDVRNLADRFTAMSKMVIIFFFQMRGHDVIDLAKVESYRILEGVRLGRTYPIWLVGETSPVPDGGPIANSTMTRQDWLVISLRQAA